MTFIHFGKLKVNKHCYYWCSHTDSNREPTDYKSVGPVYFV